MKWGKNKGKVFFSEMKLMCEISLVVLWLRLHTPSAGGLGSIPGQGTRSPMLQLRVRIPQLKDPSCWNTNQRSCMPQLRSGSAK